MRFRIIGPGRAGGAFATALTSVGWDLDASYGRDDDPGLSATGVDLLLVCVPDRSISTVASEILPGEAALVHVAGSQTLDVLASHDRVGSVHPLMALPDAERGSQLLLDRCHFAVEGDSITKSIVDALGGIAFNVSGDDRTRYHATAAVASNHLVALTAQVKRLSESVGVPAEAFWPLMMASLANVVNSDPRSALTGPVARADWDTVRSHLDALDPTDSALYLAMATEAARLAGQELPSDLSQDLT